MRSLLPAFVHQVVEDMDAGNATGVRRAVAGLHSADLAELIELVRPDERRVLLEVLGGTLAPEVLRELEGSVLDEVMAQLEPGEMARAVQALETGDAVSVLEGLDATDQRHILDQLPPTARTMLESSLEHPPGSTGRLMRRDLVAVPPFWTVGQTIDYLRGSPGGDFYEIFVVDPAFRPVGALPLSRVLRAGRTVPVAAIMERAPMTLPVDMDQEDAAYRFEKYSLVSAAVVDGAGRLVGQISADDMVEVITAEAGQDIRRLGGVGDERLSDTVLRISRRRFNWLFVNLITAVLASMVIGLFDGAIHAMVALAILMPIVASMGGNAGTQTLTVAVRALSRRDLLSFNARRVVGREALVGGLNGLLFAALLGAGAGLWFGSSGLGLVLAAAMVVNMVIAGLAGILIPLGLARVGVDPAIASGVFVTTVTDVAGFFVFLGLAAWLLL